MRRGSRTPLPAMIRRAYRSALAPDRESKGATRREFLKQAAALSAAAVAGGGLAVSCAGPERSTSPGGAPRIVIVGAGIAGLNAAWRLQKRGLAASVYESSARAGGRMYSARDLLAPGLVTELGGEFIDSDHEDLLSLCRELRLDLWDVEETYRARTENAYYFGGRIVGEKEVIEALRPFVPRLKADIELLGDGVTFENPGRAEPLDRQSIAAYLDGLGVDGWLRSLLEVAFVTEYGLDAGDQSCLNLLLMIAPDARDRFKPFGDSDERFKVRGGNMSVCTQLARKLESRLHLEQKLEAIRPAGSGFSLAFRDPQGRSREVAADYVILTLPFTTLRAVDIGVDLPPVKRKSIAELGYGTSSKLLMGVSRRPWAERGYRGDCFADEPFQMAWENSLCQTNDAAGLTVFQGGSRVAELAKGTADEQVARLAPGLDKVFPGTADALTGRNSRFLWASHPHTLGGYACYKPGQWTTIAGAEIQPVGRLYFAGEHCSLDFQGFMNGGAQTGRLAADAIHADVTK